MASKEEVLIQVKAELSGFKKSMEQIKKIAQDTVKDIEKSMAMDLTDAGSKAGKTFVNGFNNQVKNMANNINATLKNAGIDKVEVKLEADTSSIKNSLSGLSGSVDVDTNASGSGTDLLGSAASLSAASSISNALNKPINAKDEVLTYAKYVGYVKDGFNKLEPVVEKAKIDLKSLDGKELKILNDYAIILKNELSNLEKIDFGKNIDQTSLDYFKAKAESILPIVDELKQKIDSLEASPNAPNMDNFTNEVNEASDGVDELNEKIITLKDYMNKLGGEDGWGQGIQNVIDYIMDGLKDIDDSERKAKAAAEDWADTYDKVGVSLERVMEEANLLAALDTFDNSQESGIAFLRVLKEIDDRYKGTLSSIQATDLGKILADKFDIPIDPTIFEDIGNNITKALKDIDRDADFSMVTGDIDHLADAFELSADRIRRAMLQIRMATGSSGGSPMTTALSGSERPLNRVINKIQQLAQTAKTKLTTAFKSVTSAVVSFGAKAINAITKLPKLLDTARSKVQGLGNKLTSMVSSVPGLNKIANAINNIGRSSGDSTGKVSKLSNMLSGMVGKLLGLFGAYQIFSLFKEGTKDAMQYEASIMNLQRTLGIASTALVDTNDKTADFANTTAVSFGLSKKQVAEYGNIFSVIMMEANKALASQGDTLDDVAAKTADTSQKLLESAGIISAALGYDTATVLEGLRSALLGSSEAVDQYGLSMKVASLEASEAFAQIANGATSWNDLSAAQQQAIIAQEILNQTTARYGSILTANGQIMASTASMHNAFTAQLANTKLAFGNMGKAIYTAVLPALTALMAVLEKVFNYVAKVMSAILGLFGIKVNFSGGGGTGSSIGGLTNSLGDVGSAAGGAGDALNNAGNAAKNAGSGAKKAASDTKKAAKEIKRALAGFDQINVLSLGKDADSSSPGSGGSSTPPGGGSSTPGGGGSSTPPGGTPSWDPNDALTEVTFEQEPLDGWAKGLLDWIKTIDFQPLIDSFNRLKESVKPILETCGKLIMWFFTNVLAPLAKWTIEKVIPNFFDGLSNILRILSPILDAAVDAFIIFNDAVLIPIAKWVADKFIKAWEEVNKVLKAFGDWLNGDGKWCAEILGTLAGAFGVIAEVVLIAIGVFKVISGIIGGFKAVIGGLAAAWTFLTSPIGLVVLAIAAVIAIIVLCIKHWDKIKEVAIKCWEGIKNAWSNVATWFKGIFEKARDAVVKVWNFYKAYYTGVWNGIKKIFNNVASWFKKIFKAAWDAIVKVWNFYKSYYTALWNGIKKIFSGVVNFYKETFTKAWEAVKKAWDGAVKFYKGVWDGIVKIFSVVANWFKTQFTNAWNNVKKAWDGAVKFFKDVWTNISNAFKDVANWFKTQFTNAWNNVKKAWEGAVKFFKDIWTNISNAFKDAANWFKTQFTNAWNNVKKAWEGAVKFFKDVWTNISNAFKDAATWFKTQFTNAWNNVKKAWEGAVKFFKDVWTNISNVFKDVATWFKTQFTNAWNNIKTAWNSTKTFFSGVWDGIKSVFSSVSTWFKEKFEAAKKAITDAFDGAKSGVQKAWDNIKNVFTNAKSTIAGYFSGVGSSISDKFSDAKSKVQTAWNNIKNVFSGAKDTIAGYFKGVGSKIGDAFSGAKTSASNALSAIRDTVSGWVTKIKNAFSFSLPKFKVPKPSINIGSTTKTVLGVKIKVPTFSVSWNKLGGIFNKPTIFNTRAGLQGVGEAGPEAILPLDRLWSELDRQFQRQTATLNNSLNGGNSNKPVNITLKLNDIEMGKATVNSLKALANHSGSIDLPL